MIAEPQAIFWALVGGVLPAMFWLWFWLQEDKLHPEPRIALMKSFLIGMLAVIIVLPFEKLAQEYLPAGVATITVWATIEEVFKFLGVYIVALTCIECDEPIDYLIYLITGAVGFAALENTLFIVAPLANGDIMESIITGNLRFVGASLLHIITAGVIGSFMAFAFYKSRAHKLLPTIIGLAVAIGLHAFFNLSIINTEGASTIGVFSVVWIAIIFLLIVFEKVKKIAPPIKN